MLIVKPKTEHEITEYPDLIAEQIQQLLDRRDELEAEIQELEDAGIAGANPHYREDKYLYLIYPTQPDGSRKREYIGNKPEAIQEALARVERFKIHATKSRELKDLRVYAKICGLRTETGAKPPAEESSTCASARLVTASRRRRAAAVTSFWQAFRQP